MEPNPELNWNNMTIILAGAFAIIFIRFLLKRITGAGEQKGGKPPRVGGGWPLIGHLPLLTGPELPQIKLSGLADKYGPIFSIQLGIHSAVVINSWEVAKQIFTTHDGAVSSRLKIQAGKILGYNYAVFALSHYGSYWRNMRKIAALELLSNRRIELLTQAKESEMNQAIKELYQVWKDIRKDPQDQGSVDMKQWLGELTLNIILRVVVGKRYVGIGAMVEEEEARQWQKATREALRYFGSFILGDVVPYLGWLDVGGHVKAMKRTSKVLDRMLTQWLEEHKKHSAFGKPTKDKDFIDAMLSSLKEPTHVDVLSHGFDHDTIIKATCLTMILGGGETIGVVVTWALSLLLNNPPELKRVQEELDTHVGTARKLNESDIDKLVYLQAVVKETMRLYGAGGFVFREATENFSVNGFQIEKGTWVFVNQWKIHRDEKVWAEPLKFKPERFLTTNHKGFDVKGQQFELIPFGGGRRMCPGFRFGLQMVQLILGKIVHGFDVATLENGAVDMKGSIGLTNVKASPLHVLIRPRLPHSLYH